MSSDLPAEQGKRARSPSFPYIGLGKALERVQVLYEKAKQNEVRVADVAQNWGLAPKSSSLDRNVAALLAYGLVDDNGGGDARKIKLSESGYRILEDKRAGVKEELLAKAALKPKAVADYAQLWAGGRPDDSHSVSHLMFEGGFTDEGARIFLRVFDETIRFASTCSADKDSDSNQTIGRDKEMGPAANTPATDGLPPTPARSLPPVAPGMRQAVFALDEGDVSMTFPAGLTVDGFQELADYLDIFLRKARRQKEQEALEAAKKEDGLS